MVWRRIVVPADYTFYQLHMAIQGAFGWGNNHLFQFSKNNLMDNVSYGVVYDDDDLDPGFVKHDAEAVKISSVFKKPGQVFSYIYDFGDYWQHKIVFEKKEMKTLYCPWCIDGSGACPPEDVGGMIGYQNMLEVFRLRDDQEILRYREWLGLVEGEQWDHDFCSIREVNKRLCLLE